MALLHRASPGNRLDGRPSTACSDLCVVLALCRSTLTCSTFPAAETAPDSLNDVLVDSEGLTILTDETSGAQSPCRSRGRALGREELGVCVRRLGAESVALPCQRDERNREFVEELLDICAWLHARRLVDRVQQFWGSRGRRLQLRGAKCRVAVMALDAPVLHPPSPMARERSADWWIAETQIGRYGVSSDQRLRQLQLGSVRTRSATPSGRDDVRAAVLCGCEHAAGLVLVGVTPSAARPFGCP